MKNLSYWLDTPYSPRPSLSQNLEADIVVIGGGITGVSAAYHAALLGLNVVLLEKNEIASGAAGKNGGMVVEGLSMPFVTAVEQLGHEQASRSWQKTVDARNLVQELAKRLPIDCEISQPGSLLVSSNEAESEFLAKESTARIHAGFDAVLVSRGAQLNKSPFLEELHTPLDCAMHPVKFVRGLAEAAEKLGARIFEHSTAVVSADGIVTACGHAVSAKQIVRAVEADGTFLNDDNSVITHEQAIVTEPLSDEAMKNLDWDTGGMFWTFGEDYYNIRKIDHRLFTSGRIDENASEQDLAEHRELLLGILRQRLPSLDSEGLSVSHYWTAVTLKSDHEWPTVQEKGVIWDVFGSGDFGFTNGIMAGKSVAEEVFKRIKS